MNYYHKDIDFFAISNCNCYNINALSYILCSSVEFRNIDPIQVVIDKDCGFNDLINTQHFQDNEILA